MTAAVHPIRELRRGTGPDLGPLATRFPLADRTLLHVLQLQVDTRGDQEWLCFDGTASLTYRQAQEQAHRFGHAMLDTVGEGAHVAILTPNCAEFFGAFLGSMSAGGVAIPLNAESKGELLQRLIVASDSRIVVVHHSLVHACAELTDTGMVERFVVIGGTDRTKVAGVAAVGWDEFLHDRPTERPRPLPDSSQVAQIMFTSGTTGQAKGVVYPHHFLFMYSVVTADSAALHEDSVLFATTPLYHALALHTISGAALHAGGRAHLRSRFSAGAFWQQVAEAGATNMVLLGPMAQILAKTQDEAPPHKVKLIYCVPFPADGQEFCRKFKVKAVWQGFGMTEIFPNPYFDHDTTDVPTDSAGYPAAWVDYGVVDELDRVLPDGEIGELVFRPRIPDAMARGYYRNPEATAEAFRNLMFHTGDLASIDPDGRVRFRGRMKDRIRRMGENVSAADLETVVSGHPLVVDAAAYAVPGEFGEDEIKVDVIPLDATLDAAELHDWLSRTLPRYMVPRYLELMTELPRTPSGKIEKHKLAARPVDRDEVREFVPARRR